MIAMLPRVLLVVVQGKSPALHAMELDILSMLVMHLVVLRVVELGLGRILSRIMSPTSDPERFPVPLVAVPDPFILIPIPRPAASTTPAEDGSTPIPAPAVIRTPPEPDTRRITTSTTEGTGAAAATIPTRSALAVARRRPRFLTHPIAGAPGRPLRPLPVLHQEPRPVPAQIAVRRKLRPYRPPGIPMSIIPPYRRHAPLRGTIGTIHARNARRYSTVPRRSYRRFRRRPHWAMIGVLGPPPRPPHAPHPALNRIHAPAAPFL